METFLNKNVKNSLKKVLKENRAICEECLGEGCSSCMNEHHPMDASKRIGGKYESTYSNIDKISNLVSKDNITINTVLMSVNTENIIKFFEYYIKIKIIIFI